jgi:DNA-binding response OmpR family regulator
MVISCPGKKVEGMSKGRILVVEDEPLIAMLLEDSLEEAGYECVAVCTTAESALAVIEKVQIDAVLMNLVLKGTPAYDVCAALAVRQIPFAFASGVSRESIEPLWQERLFIAKPFSQTEIHNTLDTLLAAPAASVASLIDDMPPPATAST